MSFPIRVSFKDGDKRMGDILEALFARYSVDRTPSKKDGVVYFTIAADVADAKDVRTHLEGKELLEAVELYWETDRGLCPIPGGGVDRQA